MDKLSFRDYRGAVLTTCGIRAFAAIMAKALAFGALKYVDEFIYLAFGETENDDSTIDKYLVRWKVAIQHNITVGCLRLGVLTVYIRSVATFKSLI